MIITNKTKSTDNINKLAKGKPLFSKQSIFDIQDTIEIHSVEYSPSDIKNEEFLELIADKWPEDYMIADYPLEYTYYLNHNDTECIGITLKLIEKENEVLIDSVFVAYYK